MADHGRRNVVDALNHRQPRHVPVDFGATAVTGMHVSCVAGLQAYYGLPSHPVKVVEPYQMLGEIDGSLRRILGIDTVGVSPRHTMFGFPNENWKDWRTPWGQYVLVSEHFNTALDTNGDTLIYPQGDTTAPPSGRLPVGGYFFDAIVRQEPLDERYLDPRDNLEEFGHITFPELDHIREETARALGMDAAIVGTVPGAGLGDIALVPAPFLKYPRGIRDVAEWYMLTATRPDYVHEVFAAQTAYTIANLQSIHQTIGNHWDVAMVCGTDFGTQNSTFCSPDLFDELYAPYYREINDWIHRYTTWRTFKHSCGAVYPLIERFIDVGFDILNPVQCSAAGMDPQQLKYHFGDYIVFWGGGIDTQRTLPFGTPDDVRREVLERCEVFGRDGGFVFNSVHNIQAGTPIENIVAMFDAVRDFNGIRL